MTAPARLAAFESYSPYAENAAFDHFGKSALEEIESILGKPSPDWDLRAELALALWKYARGSVGWDGSGQELADQVRHYIEPIEEAARSLRDALRQIGVSPSFPSVGRRPRRRSRRSYEEVHWAKLSPLFRAAHNRLREVRGLSPIPEPEPDLYEPLHGGTIRPLDPVDPEAVDHVAAGTVAIVLAAGGVNTTVVLEQLDTILSVTEKGVTGKDGRPRKDPEFWLLMDDVAYIFETETHRRATLTEKTYTTVASFSGRFFRMAELVDAAAARATQRDARSNSALGSLLKDCLDLRVKPLPN
jgi:hypothetical protein